MALIKCQECKKEISDKASACPHCGCPIESMNIASEQDAPKNDTVNFLKNSLSSVASSAVEKTKENIETARHTRKIGIISINDSNNTFKIDGAVLNSNKKTGLVGGMFRGVMAVGTVGISLAAEKALGFGKAKVGGNVWYNFKDLIGYELLEDDSIVTSGGVGQALIGGAIFGGFGAVAGGVTGKRVQKKKVDSLYVKITLNSYDSPCLLIPFIIKSTKTDSKEYQSAFKIVHQLLSTLDVITHNT